MIGYFRRMAVTVAIGASAFVAIAGSAHAVPLSFDRITSNSSADASNQFVVDVTDGGTGALVSFGVVTGSNPQANIHEIYFSDLSTLFAPPPVFVSKVGQVSFTLGSANPANLPSGGNATPPFVVTAGLLADINSQGGGSNNGVTVGENLTLRLNYTTGSDFDDVLAAISGGQFRVALHVGSLLAGESDSFVSTPPPTSQIPLPATALLLLGGIGGLGGMSFLRRKA